jgi:hypothetical protein
LGMGYDPLEAGGGHGGSVSSRVLVDDNLIRWQTAQVSRVVRH